MVVGQDHINGIFCRSAVRGKSRVYAIADSQKKCAGVRAVSFIHQDADQGQY